MKTTDSETLKIPSKNASKTENNIDNSNTTNKQNIIFLNDKLLKINDTKFYRLLFKLLRNCNNKIATKIINFFNPGSISERKVRILSQLKNKTNSRIVLISHNRENIWNAYNHNDNNISKEDIYYINRLLKLFKKYKISIAGITDSDKQTKDKSIEIMNYLSRHEVKHFVIIDGIENKVKLSYLFGSHYMPIDKSITDKTLNHKYELKVLNNFKNFI